MLSTTVAWWLHHLSFQELKSQLNYDDDTGYIYYTWKDGAMQDLSLGTCYSLDTYEGLSPKVGRPRCAHKLQPGRVLQPS